MPFHPLFIKADRQVNKNKLKKPKLKNNLKKATKLKKNRKKIDFYGNMIQIVVYSCYVIILKRDWVPVSMEVKTLKLIHSSVESTGTSWKS